MNVKDLRPPESRGESKLSPKFKAKIKWNKWIERYFFITLL